ncbi:MAG: ATP-binding protein, partial [Hyphomicrobium sp.]
MHYEIAAPRASALVESLRGVGYSPSTAIADLVDNSISAGARNIWLTFKFDGSMSTISLLDDGCGMSEVELRQAMVLGARNPLDTRSNGDLGRFGLGLKTASFSQCRCLTVAARKDNIVSVRRWDLDYLTKMAADDWRLLIGPRDGSEALISPLTQITTGTLVVWETLDRIVGGARSDDRKAEDAFNAMIEAVDHHLGMVFQRFLDRPNSPLRLYINGRRVRAWDPFMRSHPATEFTPSEAITAQSGMVTLQGFVLPHKDQMTEDELRRGAGSQGWAAHQGFYIYRGNRLMVAGGWLGLGTPRPWTMEEPYRLARISVDFDNTADTSWEIDVKKSVARPPRQLRPRMTDLADV